MQRRDFVKAIVAASAASVSTPAALSQQTETLPPPTAKVLAPEPWMRGLLDAKPLPIIPLIADAIARSDTRFFTETQAATLRRLAGVFQPPQKGYPGALQAGTPEFLDFLIGASPADRQQMYVAGLERLEAEAQQHFHKPFANVDEAEAAQLIRPWLRTWMSDHPPAEPYARFINLAHVNIRDATVNSQAWSDAAQAAGRPTPNVNLYWHPVDPDLRHTAPATSSSN
jgi:hypothetical protein